MQRARGDSGAGAPDVDRRSVLLAATIALVGSVSACTTGGTGERQPDGATRGSSGSGDTSDGHAVTRQALAWADELGQAAARTRARATRPTPSPSSTTQAQEGVDASPVPSPSSATGTTDVTPGTRGVAPTPRTVVEGLVTAHASQDRALTGLLGGLSSTTTAAAGGLTSPPAQLTAADLARLEAERAADLRSLLAEVDPAHLPTLLALAGHWGAAAALLPERPPRLGSTLLPALPRTTSAPIAADLLVRVREVRYGLEVAAAHLVGEARARARVTLDAVEARGAELLALAGDRAPSAPLGYALPHPVRDADDADLLVRTVLAAWARSVHAQGLAVDLDDADRATGLASAALLLGEAARLGAAWSQPLAPLPGTAVDGTPTPAGTTTSPARSTASPR